MNKRQSKKEYKKLGKSIRFCCSNYGTDVCEEPEECLMCEEYQSMLTKKTFVKMLKKEGFSTSGWKFAENPATGVYIFYNHKKHKEITLETGDYKSYAITVYDFHSLTNVAYLSMDDALKSPYHNFFYAPEFWKSVFTMKKRKEARERFFEGGTRD